MSETLYKKLAEPFPPEAMTADKSRGFALTSIKAQYVRERLNEVMGVNGWESNTEVVNIDNEGNVAVKMSMTLHFENRSVTRSAFGGADKKAKGQTFGDTFKSAETDALSKVSSNFGVGNDVFKGLVDANKLGSSTTAKSKDGFRKSTPKKTANKKSSPEPTTDAGW